jgi:hypothetical protein
MKRFNVRCVHSSRRVLARALLVMGVLLGTGGVASTALAGAATLGGGLLGTEGSTTTFLHVVPVTQGVIGATRVLDKAVSVYCSEPAVCYGAALSNRESLFESALKRYENAQTVMLNQAQHRNGAGAGGVEPLAQLAARTRSVILASASVSTALSATDGGLYSSAVRSETLVLQHALWSYKNAQERLLVQEELGYTNATEASWALGQVDEATQALSTALLVLYNAA